MFQTTAAILLAAALAGGQAFAACTCGPDFCQDDTRLPGALASKKKELAAAGYPQRLIALLKGQCVAAIERAPTAFHIRLVESDNHWKDVSWSADDEALAKNELASHKLARFWIFNTARALACCKEPGYDQRPDYDATDDVNTSGALRCDLQHAC